MAKGFKTQSLPIIYLLLPVAWDEHYNLLISIIHRGVINYKKVFSILSYSIAPFRVFKANCTVLINFVYQLGSDSGSVGRSVTSDSRGLRFKFSHWQKIILNIYCQLYWKEENKENEAGNGPFKKNFIYQLSKITIDDFFSPKTH